LCGPHQELIREKVGHGLDARRIHQDLVFEHGFTGGYDSVKRFCRGLRHREPAVFTRVETGPGCQVQVDFARGAPTRYPNSEQYRRPWLFEAVLSFSRHRYCEVVWRQDLPTWIRCFENAFEFFGGTVEVVRIDNLKVGIQRACFYDPEVNPVFAAFGRHYGFAVLPIHPRSPRENGKVERAHSYTDSSALRGRRFESLEEQNRHLDWWNRHVARMRIHGTTKEQVWARFESQEKPALKALPTARFALFRSGTRTVYSDGHVEVERAFYSVPHRYLGHILRVEYDDRLVRIYEGEQSVAIHARVRPGLFQTEQEHLPENKRYVHLRIENDLLVRAKAVGAEARLWAERALQERGVLAYRVLQGMLSLTRRHSAAVVNQACATALHHQAFRYRTLVALCKRREPQQRSLFTEEHELIRPLSEFQQLFDERTKA